MENEAWNQRTEWGTQSCTLSWDKPTLIMNGPSTGYLLLEYYCKHFLVVFEPHLNMLVDWAPYNAHERSLRSGDMWLKNVKNRVSFGFIRYHSNSPVNHHFLHFFTDATWPTGGISALLDHRKATSNSHGVHTALGPPARSGLLPCGL